MGNEGADENQMFTGYELSSVYDRYKSLDEAMITIAENFPDYLSSHQLTGLAELITGRWRERCQSKGVKHDENYRLKNPLRQFTLTETMTSKLETGIELCSNKRFRIAIDRWNTGLRRADPLDAVLDLCSSLEACFGLSSELRLRLSFAVRAVLKRNKKTSAKLVYEMYGVRNDFIHGSKIPEISRDQKAAFIAVVSEILVSIIRKGAIPSAQVIQKEIFSS